MVKPTNGNATVACAAMAGGGALDVGVVGSACWKPSSKSSKSSSSPPSSKSSKSSPSSSAPPSASSSPSPSPSASSSGRVSSAEMDSPTGCEGGETSEFRGFESGDGSDASTEVRLVSGAALSERNRHLFITRTSALVFGARGVIGGLYLVARVLLLALSLIVLLRDHVRRGIRLVRLLYPLPELLGMRLS